MVDPVSFGSRYVGPGHPVVIVAEVGINHEGSLTACEELISAAAQAGADAVKLQTIDPDESYAPDTPSYTVFHKAILNRDETARAFLHARSVGLEVFTTVADQATLDFVDSLEPAAHKISSGLLTHTPLIEHAARTQRTLIMSTGASVMKEVDAAVLTAREAGTRALCLLQTTSTYPAPEEEANLAVMRAFEERFGVPAGYSDHTIGNEVALLAIAAGARLVEKHFTLDRSRAGFDHHISADADGLRALVKNVRDVEGVVGSSEKVVQPSEAAARVTINRSLVAKRDIIAGASLSAEDIGVVRLAPGKGKLPPSLLSDVIGRAASRDLRRHEPVGPTDLSPPLEPEMED